jgi:hypothetical protein
VRGVLRSENPIRPPKNPTNLHLEPAMSEPASLPEIGRRRLLLLGVAAIPAGTLFAGAAPRSRTAPTAETPPAKHPSAAASAAVTSGYVYFC